MVSQADRTVCQVTQILATPFSKQRKTKNKKTRRGGSLCSQVRATRSLHGWNKTETATGTSAVRSTFSASRSTYPCLSTMTGRMPGNISIKSGRLCPSESNCHSGASQVHLQALRKPLIFSFLFRHAQVRWEKAKTTNLY